MKGNGGRGSDASSLMDYWKQTWWTGVWEVNLGLLLLWCLAYCLRTVDTCWLMGWFGAVIDAA